MYLNANEEKMRMILILKYNLPVLKSKFEDIAKTQQWLIEGVNWVEFEVVFTKMSLLVKHILLNTRRSTSELGPSNKHFYSDNHWFI